MRQMTTSREIARKFRDFIHYVDSCGDYWWLVDDSKIRSELAQILITIRQKDFHWKIWMMDFFCRHYFIPWSHPCSYNKEFEGLIKEVLNEF